MVVWEAKCKQSKRKKVKVETSCVFCDCSVVWQEEEEREREKRKEEWLCMAALLPDVLYKVNITLAQGDGMIIFLTGCFFAETTCSHVFKHYTCVQVCRGDRWETLER